MGLKKKSAAPRLAPRNGQENEVVDGVIVMVHAFFRKCFADAIPNVKGDGDARNQLHIN